MDEKQIERIRYEEAAKGKCGYTTLIIGTQGSPQVIPCGSCIVCLSKGLGVEG